MVKRIMALGSLLLALALLLGCSDLAKAVDKPFPVIVGQTSSDAVGLDYIIYVDCTVENQGDPGNVTVTAHLSRDGTWQESQQVYLAAGETRKLTFRFSEPQLFGGSGRYFCSAKAD